MLFKASNAPVDPRQVEKVTVTVKLHADDSAADGNRAVTSKVNRPAISPVVNVGVAAARRPPAGKVGSPKTGKKLFLAKGLGGGQLSRKKVLWRSTVQCYLRYEGVCGGQFCRKKRYVTLEWPHIIVSWFKRTHPHTKSVSWQLNYPHAAYDSFM